MQLELAQQAACLRVEVQTVSKNATPLHPRLSCCAPGCSLFCLNMITDTQTRTHAVHSARCAIPLPTKGHIWQQEGNSKEQQASKLEAPVPQEPSGSLGRAGLREQPAVTGGHNAWSHVAGNEHTEGWSRTVQGMGQRIPAGK